MLLDLLIFRANIIAYYTASAARRLIQSCQHVHGGCLSSTIGSEESEYLAFPNSKTNIIHGME